MRAEQREILSAADDIASFAMPLERFAGQHPEAKALVWEGVIPSFHHWGVTGIWNYSHHTIGLPALYVGSAGIKEIMETQPVAIARWQPGSRKMLITIQPPIRP
jgi:hypothetical protein